MTTTTTLEAPAAKEAAGADWLEPDQFDQLTLGDYPADVDIWTLTVMLYDAEPEYMAELEADIERHGVLEPVEVHEGVVNNGHHRLAVAFSLGLPVRLSGMHPPTDRDTLWRWRREEIEGKQP